MQSLSDELAPKYELLSELITSYGRVIVAFSGGVDSSLVAYVATQILGTNALAVTSASSSLKRSDLELTKKLAEKWQLNHQIIITDELSKAEYRANPTNRCFHCKTSLYSQLDELAKQRDFKFVLNGTNLDDLGDHRPGLVAADNYSVKSPLCEAGFHKRDIRELASYFGMDNAEKPAAACLSSRVPYGSSINEDILKQIESAESILDQMGFNNFRVRHHEDVARIEVDRAEMLEVLEHADEIEKLFKILGYRFVALDLKGFRSGSLNEGLINVVRVA